MDDPESLRTRQVVWEFVSPLLDRLDQLKHDVGELRDRIKECEARLDRLGRQESPAALPPAAKAEGAAGEE